jgi:hypothetical protein
MAGREGWVPMLAEPGLAAEERGLTEGVEAVLFGRSTDIGRSTERLRCLRPALEV